MSAGTMASQNREDELRSLSHVGVVADRSVGVMLVDARGCVHDATPSACELLGVASVEALRSEGHSACEQLRSAFEVTGPAPQSVDLSFEVCGSDRVLRCHVHPLTEGDRLSYLVLVQAVDHVAAIERAVLLASRARMLGSVHGMAAHDLRDSLNSMTINLELLSRTLDDEAVDGQISAIRQRCMTALRQEVKQLALSIGGALEESRASNEVTGRVRLTQVIESIVLALRGGAFRQRVTMRFTPPVHEIDVMGRAGELRHAVFNLAVNALDTMPDGGTLTFTLTREGSRAAIAVSDTGAGVPAEVRSRVWDLFFSTKREGLGLGLHVVKRIAVAHGGTVTLDAGAAGATVTMRLPLAGGRN